MGTATQQPQTQDSTAQAVAQTRIDLAATHRIAVLENLHEGTWNHFSTKVPGRPDHILLSPGRTHFSRVTASSLVMTNEKGAVVEGNGTPNISAWAIHQPIQQARPDVFCALHVHSPYATALASIDGWRFNERAGQHAGNFYGKVAYFDYEGIVTEAEEGEHMAACIGDNKVLFLANHGVLVVGETVEIAMLQLLSLERACQTELLALWTGRSIREIPKEVAHAVANRKDGFGEVGYLDAMKDVLDHEGQDYAN